MATIGKIITNSKNGQSYKFITTAQSSSGAFLEIESNYLPNTSEPPLHYHPFQEEHFIILDGQVTVRIGKDMRVLRRGEELYIPAGTKHAMWNRTNLPATVNWKVIPALNTEYFFETITGLVNDGETNDNSKPRLLQIALIANHFSNVFRQSKPPFFLQRIIFYFLTPFAIIAGYKPTYKKYLD